MKKNKRIIQIIPDFEFGGAEIMVENLAVTLKKYGFEVIIVTLYDKKTTITKRLENNDIYIYYLNKKKGLDIKIIYELYRLFSKEKPYVVHSHLYAMKYVTPAAIFARIPIRIHTIHSLANKEVSETQRKIHNFFYRYCHVLPVSIAPEVKKSVREEYNLSEEQMPMIYNGIDLRKCIPKTSYTLNSHINIIHIGSFKKAKNHDGIIESFKMIHNKEPNTVLTLIGAGEMEETIRKKVSEYGLTDCVEFVGTKSDVFTYLNEADIFVLPSLWEGMPITLIEAMGTGLPIVATKVGGIPSMIEDNVSGILVGVDNKEIADAVLRLVYDANLRKRLGITARKKSEKFSSEKMAKEYIDLYG